MEAVKQKNYSADALLAEFFAQDDLKSLAADAGALLDCPLLVLDDTFHVVAYHRPLGFSDPLFQASVSRGEITYEAGAIISRSEALMAGTADYVKLEDSVYRRRFAPLISSGVRLGFLICVDTDGHLQKSRRKHGIRSSRFWQNRRLSKQAATISLLKRPRIF